MKKIRSKIEALECSQYYTNVHHFLDAQGQITLELVVVSGRNLNSSKLSCMSSLPARMRTIAYSMKRHQDLMTSLVSLMTLNHFKISNIIPTKLGTFQLVSL